MMTRTKIGIVILAVVGFFSLGYVLETPQQKTCLAHENSLVYQEMAASGNQDKFAALHHQVEAIHC